MLAINNFGLNPPTQISKQLSLIIEDKIFNIRDINIESNIMGMNTMNNLHSDYFIPNRNEETASITIDLNNFNYVSIFNIQEYFYNLAFESHTIEEIIVYQDQPIILQNVTIKSINVQEDAIELELIIGYINSDMTSDNKLLEKILLKKARNKKIRRLL